MAEFQDVETLRNTAGLLIDECNRLRAELAAAREELTDLRLELREATECLIKDEASLAAARAQAGRLRGAIGRIVEDWSIEDFDTIFVRLRALATPADAGKEPILITRIAFPESNYRPTDDATKEAADGPC